MILDNAILQGQPHFPHDMVEVSGVIKEHQARFVYIAPWFSSVSGGSGCRTLKTPGEPSIRCCRWQSITLRLVLAVAHPTIGEGDLRARVGLSAPAETGDPGAAVRDRPPDYDTQLIVRMEKANAPPTHRQPSTGKCHAITRCCPRGLSGRRDYRRTQIDVRQWHERYGTDRDHRRSDHWPLLLLLLITAWSDAPTL